MDIKEGLRQAITFCPEVKPKWCINPTWTDCRYCMVENIIATLKPQFIELLEGMDLEGLSASSLRVILLDKLVDKRYPTEEDAFDPVLHDMTDSIIDNMSS